MEETKKKPRVFMPELIKLDLIDLDLRNTNKQDKETFEGLVENIEEEGFDENIIVIQKNNGRFEVKSGNHRVQAARAAGLEEVPAVVRDDWDTAKAAMQGVRRNVQRGQQSKAAFTELVNDLHEEYEIDLSDIQEGMGFVDPDEFATLYQAEKRREEKEIERTINENAPIVKMMDDVTAMVNHLFSEYGDTLALSFLCFPMGGKQHLYVNSTNALKNVLAKVVVRCKETGLDLPTALTGLIHIGMSQSEFMKSEVTESMDELEKELTIDPDDDNLDV